MNFPEIIPDAETFDLLANTLNFESPFNKVSQTARLNGDQWVLVAAFTNRDGKSLDGRTLKAFIRGLAGRQGRFDYRPSDYTPLGTPTGTPLVNGASQLGSTLITDGWTPSTRIFEPGDYFTVNGELKEIDAPIDSDGSGNATLTFHPPLRRDPPDDSPLNVDDPRVTMRLTSDSNPFSISTPVIYSVTFEAIEALDL